MGPTQTPQALKHPQLVKHCLLHPPELGNSGESGIWNTEASVLLGLMHLLILKCFPAGADTLPWQAVLFRGANWCSEWQFLLAGNYFHPLSQTIACRILSFNEAVNKILQTPVRLATLGVKTSGDGRNKTPVTFLHHHVS